MLGVRAIKSQYYMRRMGTERCKSHIDVAVFWMKREISKGETLKTLCSRIGGSTCLYYGVVYGTLGGPGFGKIEAHLFGHEPKVFTMQEVFAAMCERYPKQGRLFAI